jgi:hypothetical protein
MSLPSNVYIRQERRPIETKTAEGWKPAIFHCWGTDADGETVAVYEMIDGSCSMNNVWNIRFLDTDPDGWFHFCEYKEKQDAGAQ